MNTYRCNRPNVVGCQWRAVLRWSALPIVLALAAIPAVADEDAAVVYIRPVPAPVAAVTRCDETGPADLLRVHRFHGGVPDGAAQFPP